MGGSGYWCSVVARILAGTLLSYPLDPCITTDSNLPTTPIWGFGVMSFCGVGQALLVRRVHSRPVFFRSLAGLKCGRVRTGAALEEGVSNVPRSKDWHPD